MVYLQQCSCTDVRRKLTVNHRPTYENGNSPYVRNWISVIYFFLLIWLLISNGRLRLMNNSFYPCVAVTQHIPMEINIKWCQPLPNNTYTVETHYKEIWYNKIPDITKCFLWSQWHKLLCFVLFIDYWYNKISDITNKISWSQGSHYTSFPCIWLITTLSRIYKGGSFQICGLFSVHGLK